MEATAAPLHIFVYVVRSRQDPFAGIRLALQRDGEKFAQIEFDEIQLNLIDSIEYTKKRFLRPWFYRPIFRRLTSNLTGMISNHNGPVYLYMADEGVWAVFLSQLISQMRRSGIYAVNVQHGVAILSPAKFKIMRRILNRVATFCTGFPAIGMGSVGGAGPLPFHIYLTYDEGTAAFARSQTARPALPAPRLIKHELIEAYYDVCRPGEKSLRILFAMNMDIQGSPILCDVNATFDSLMDLAKAVREAGAIFVIRPHPGMNQSEVSQQFAAHEIASFATLDPEVDLYASIARSRIVMSFLSTALWEGGLLGLLPVQVLCRCCKPVTLSYACEQIDLARDVRAQLAQFLVRAHGSKQEDWRAIERQEWDSFKALLGTVGDAAD